MRFWLSASLIEPSAQGANGLLRTGTRTSTTGIVPISGVRSWQPMQISAPRQRHGQISFGLGPVRIDSVTQRST